MEPRSRLVSGSTAVAVWVDLWGSIPITNTGTNNLSSLVGGVFRGRHSDLRLPPAGGGVPVLSQASDGDQQGSRTLREPTLRPVGWQEVFRAIPVVSYGTLRTRRFEHETANPYKSEVMFSQNA